MPMQRANNPRPHRRAVLGVSLRELEHVLQLPESVSVSGMYLDPRNEALMLVLEGEHFKAISESDMAPLLPSADIWWERFTHEDGTVWYRCQVRHAPETTGKEE